jgi:hypothetical protein
MYYTELGTTKVSADRLGEMTAAINSQMANDFCPTFGIAPPTWEVLASGTSAQPGDLVITLMDQDQSVPGALGYHSEESTGVKFGSILVDPCLADLSPDPLVSVAQCLSHECCEALADIACDVWVLGTNGKLWAQEVCDPVESSTYVIGNVTVSDFLTPAFFDDQPLAGSVFDHLQVLSAGFSIAKGGYAVQWAPGSAQPQQVFGDDYPEWRKATKERPFARTLRRLAGASAVTG